MVSPTIRRILTAAVATSLATLVGISSPASAVIPNPEGVLLGRTTAVIPANPISGGHTFTNAAVANIGWDGGSDYWKALSNFEMCPLVWEFGTNAPTLGSDNYADTSEHHPFVTQNFEVLVGGSYTFRVVKSNGIADPYLALYDSNGFDKLNPDTGVVGCNDDRTEALDDFADNGVDSYPYEWAIPLWSEFHVDIPAGNYTLVMSSYAFFVNDNDWYNGGQYNTVSGGLDFSGNGDRGQGSAASAVWEFWGPENGIVAPIECEECAEGLAPTGGSTDTLLGALLISSIALGGAVIVRRRRS